MYSKWFHGTSSLENSIFIIKIILVRATLLNYVNIIKYTRTVHIHYTTHTVIMKKLWQGTINCCRTTLERIALQSYLPTTNNIWKNQQQTIYTRIYIQYILYCLLYEYIYIYEYILFVVRVYIRTIDRFLNQWYTLYGVYWSVQQLVYILCTV